MKKIFLISILLSILLCSFVSAEDVQTLGIFKKGSNVALFQSCSNCTYNNISYINYPNMSSIFTDVAMVKSGYSYSYDLDGNYTETIGRYIVCGYGDPDGTIVTWCYDFFINGTGREEPSGAITTFFIIAFILILSFFVVVFIYSLGHAIKKDFDLIDLGMDFGVFFAVLGLFLLQQEYLGNVLMEKILNTFVYIGSFTHIFLPTIFFIISIFRATSEKRQHVISGGIK